MEPKYPDLYTRTKLKEGAPNGERLSLQEYETIAEALSKTKFRIYLTFTTTKPITDIIDFEGLVQRFTYQLRRAVLGKRKGMEFPIFAVIEKGKVLDTKHKGYHAHILIGGVKDNRIPNSRVPRTHPLEKRIYPAIQKILKRLTYRSKGGKIGKMGRYDVQRIVDIAPLADYVLKEIVQTNLQVAWNATTIGFNRDVSYSPSIRNIQSIGSARPNS